MLRRLAVVLAALVLAPAASALPGDPPVEQLSPAEGAELAPSADGIPVTFACPVYRFVDSGDGLFLFGDDRQYGATFSTEPTLGTDGRLTALVGVTQAQRSPELPDGQCAAFMYDVASGARPVPPQLTPGTYYWQAWRICSSCAGGYETSPVRSFSLRAVVDLRVGKPRSAFATYPALVPLTLGGVPDGTAVELQRRVGAAWRTVAQATASGGKGEAAAILPVGRQVLRVRASLGLQVETGPERGVVVQPASAPRRTSAADDGRYAASVGGGTFAVRGGGRELRDLRIRVTMLCPGPVTGQLVTQAGSAIVPRARVAPDGSVYAALARSGSAITLRGTLVQRRLKGARVTLAVGACSGSLGFTAARVGA